MKTLWAILFSTLLAGLAYSQDCKSIEKMDRGENGIMYHSPFDQKIAIAKTIKGADTSYVLRATVAGNIAVSDPKGAVIFLASHDPLKFDNGRIAYKNDDGKHLYTLTTKISGYQLTMLGLYDIATVKLHIFQEDIPLPEQKLYKEHAQCIMLK